MEEIIRKVRGYRFFQIVTQALPEDDAKLEVGNAQYHPKRCFTVYYHPKMEAKQLRICLAHELGHLFICTLLEKNPKEDSTEPISSLFGVLAILDKNDFYKNKCQEFIHENPEKVVSEFALMSNRKKVRFNRS